MTTKRLCPACRLPLLPDQIHLGDHEAGSVVFAICERCAARYRKLPAGTRHKLLNGALSRAAADPGRYWCAILPDLGAADLAAGLLAHPRYVQPALQALGWRAGHEC